MSPPHVLSSKACAYGIRKFSYAALCLLTAVIRIQRIPCSSYINGINSKILKSTFFFFSKISTHLHLTLYARTCLPLSPMRKSGLDSSVRKWFFFFFRFPNISFRKKNFGETVTRSSLNTNIRLAQQEPFYIDHDYPFPFSFCYSKQKEQFLFRRAAWQVVAHSHWFTNSHWFDVNLAFYFTTQVRTRWRTIRVDSSPLPSDCPLSVCQNHLNYYRSWAKSLFFILKTKFLQLFLRQTTVLWQKTKTEWPITVEQ